MPENINKSKSDANTNTIRLIYKGLIPIVLVLGGIAILALRIQGWSLFLGLPMVVIGVIIMIYTYDEIAQKHIDPFPDTFEDSDESHF